MRKLIAVGLLSLLFLSCVKDDSSDYSYIDWVGMWTCNEFEGDFAPQTYDVEIVERVSNNAVSIKGLYNQGALFVVEGVVDGNALDIPLQTVDGITIAGSGNLNGTADQVNLDFMVDDGSFTDEVQARLVR